MNAGQRGADSQQKRGNIRLTWYRLERYAEARAEFERLRQLPDYRAAADFHLGLIAARLNETKRAAELWREVERSSPDTALRDRASVALGRLEAGSRPPRPTAYVLAGVGHDSNPALLDESVQPAGGTGSRSAELFGAFDYPLAGASAVTTVLRGGAYARDYADDIGLDQRGIYAGLARERAAASRRLGCALDVAGSSLDGQRFTDTFSLGVNGAPAHGRTGLSLRGQLSRIAAARAYGYLQGWRLRAEAEFAGVSGPSRLRVGYQFEINDRADLVAGNEFFSHSPMRHRLGLSVDHPASARWHLQWRARYRHSYYRDPNRFVEGGTLLEQSRVEGLAQAGVQARRRLGATSNALLEYQYSRNTATVNVFEYDRHLVSLGLEWMPLRQ